ncbi:hypothetical protein RO3G_07431 [Rhizopus delemar RA 99-880]|uniref:Uncharacterized protein n=1 Tax=Rhizopus delemar (strain RA 99-880 / ATCC MYA-4621 / FGSC 9543 / NRRL 43880) TaxID=246409 RepID=I1C2P6_RHIO9|nr:hypothetical protein RO3G_07431 [Rhizopus delemar RA 99-880]|eukprot:EIE82726.1 hypothetical protein RO3G_07431 [Rhizopus delemar RA 99-880]
MPTVVNLAILVHSDFKLPVHHIHHEHPLLAKYTISVVINDSPNTSAPIFCEALMLVSALIQVIPGSILEATYFRIGSKTMILFYENNSQHGQSAYFSYQAVYLVTDIYHNGKI